MKSSDWSTGVGRLDLCREREREREREKERERKRDLCRRLLVGVSSQRRRTMQKQKPHHLRHVLRRVMQRRVAWFKG